MKVWRALTITILSVLVATAATAWTPIAGTSFEVPGSFPGTQYIDLLNPATDHALADKVGEPWVNYPAGGGEIGFSSYYYNTRNDVGLTDGDYVGVTDYATTVGSYPDGIQGFEMSDTDGKMTVTFDAVTISGATDPYVWVEYFVQATGYEADDVIRIWVEVDGAVEIDLLNTAGSDINDLGIEGAWLSLSQSLAGYTTATLRAEIDCNSASEAIYLDNIIFSDGEVPVELQSFSIE